ncbi:MAG: DHH family phosphoesterase [Desulfatiglans sp.]|jgi:nanoRNase/pAp phosphatase (c-di-AMP/oligoRNAs hydrolase)|nr:DHH family phosphoesterase [Thermodesulfobacteriota bacterium]MEE4352216.1 DHH family phosphoesterase [Desulfatiglans sp.]
MRVSTPERLRRFYDSFAPEDNVLVMINADPDAIASAMGVKRLLWRKTVGVTIATINIIKRPDNLAMIRLLGVKATHIDELDQTRFNRFVIVDSQPGHHEAFGRFDYDVVIDHHPETVSHCAFSDIRPEYGATSTIITEYLRAAKIKLSARLATGLVLGIKTDTNNFERQTLIEDVRAFQFLFGYANTHLVRKIEQSELEIGFLKYYEYALKNMRKRRDRVFVHLGPVISPDICVLIADFFMTVVSVRWSIVSGLHNGKLIVIFRNDGLRKNAGKIAGKSFGHIGPAGGHKSAARAEVLVKDLAPIVDYRDDKKLSRWIIKQIEESTGRK